MTHYLVTKSCLPTKVPPGSLSISAEFKPEHFDNLSRSDNNYSS